MCVYTYIYIYMYTHTYTYTYTEREREAERERERLMSRARLDAILLDVQLHDLQRPRSLGPVFICHRPRKGAPQKGIQPCLGQL